MRRAIVVVIFAVLAAYVTLLLRNTCFFAAGPDSSGYLGEAKMFASGRLRVEVEPLRTFGLDPSFTEVFTPLGFDAYGATTEMVPTYPAGLPVHFAIAGMIGGWRRAPYLVITLAAIVALLLMYAIARELELSTGLSIAPAAMLAASPIFITFALQPMSDLPAATWALAAIFLALRSCRAPLLAIACGAAFAIGVWIRPTNILLGIAILFALRLRFRQLAFAVLGAMPFAIALAWLQRAQYGSWFRTAYGTVGEVVHANMPCLAFHASGIVRVVTAVVVIGAIVAMFIKHELRAMLAAWFVAFFLFYSAYGYCELWLSSRFLLPAIPALIFAALLGVRSRPAIAVVAILLVIALEVRTGSKLKILRFDDYERVFPESVAYVEAHVPPNALLVSGVLSGALYNSGRWSARWDRIDAQRFAVLKTKAPVYAIISEKETAADELRRRMPGRWLALGRVRDVTLYRIE